MTTLLPVEQSSPTEPTEVTEHLHATLPAEVMAAVLQHAPIPADVAFEAWEDGAYVLAYLRHTGLR